ncbi:MAG: hypothetical protein ABJH63_08755 [Rhizobiaceae bacterium]
MKRGVTFTAMVLMLLSASELIHLYLDWPHAGLVGCIAFLLLALSLMGQFRSREWLLVVISAALAVFLVRSEGGFDGTLNALQRASFFAAFIYLVTLLKEAAQLSPSVLELGKYLTRQRRGRRYFSLAIGGHVMGVLLNFGAISLLTPLIQRGAKASTSSPEAAQRAEQQQISALLRGFSWMIMWSPTALTQAVLFASFPSVNLPLVIALGISASVVMILAGRALDRLGGLRGVETEPGPVPEFPTIAARRFAAICSTLILATYLVVWSVGVSGAIALMLVAPVVMVAWLYRRQTGPAFSKLRGTLDAARGIVTQSAPTLGMSALILGAAGFIGEAAAKLTPTSFVAETLGIASMSPWLFLCLLPIIITLGGQIALSPILVVVFLAAVINSLPVLPADPTLIVFSLGAGWAMSMTASPNASATLLISGITNIAPTTLTWRWNGLYALLCYGLFVIAFGGLLLLWEAASR